MIALANHWLVTYRGGEKVLAEFRRLFPNAGLSSLVYRRGDIPDWILYGQQGANIGRKDDGAKATVKRHLRSWPNSSNLITSPLQYIPFSWKYYKVLLPLHPWAFRRLSVARGARLILSSDAAMVKGLNVPVGVQHVCFCHSPPRYLWDLRDSYSRGFSWYKRKLFGWSIRRAREFDHAAAQKVDRFIANSEFVAERIKRIYARDSVVIYPPVAVADFSSIRPAEDFYLLVTQLTPYKRADIAVRAFSILGKRLVVIGEGSEFESLREIAGPSVRLMGRQPFPVVKDHFERCRAFLYPQIEDFGITAVEAQAAGRPVIAFRSGGALETVIEGETGIFFDEQTPESLSAAILRFEAIPARWAEPCRRNAERFRPERFRAEIKAFLGEHYPELFKDYAWPV